jgi:hypothetical protein
MKTYNPQCCCSACQIYYNAQGQQAYAFAYNNGHANQKWNQVHIEPRVAVQAEITESSENDRILRMEANLIQALETVVELRSQLSEAIALLHCMDRLLMSVWDVWEGGEAIPERRARDLSAEIETFLAKIQPPKEPETK